MKARDNEEGPRPQLFTVSRGWKSHRMKSRGGESMTSEVDRKSPELVEADESRGKKCEKGTQIKSIKKCDSPLLVARSANRFQRMKISDVRWWNTLFILLQ
jgi:hypothetical protein